MADRGAGCWESRLSGSERGWSATLDMDDILWHRQETRRQTENTNFILCLGKSPAYSNSPENQSLLKLHCSGNFVHAEPVNP
jgi:hypothetical protein